MHNMMAGFFFIRNFQLIKLSTLMTFKTWTIKVNINFLKHISLFIYRSASRLIKNLPVPLGTLVRKRARLKPAVFYIVSYINIISFLALGIIRTKLGYVPPPLLFLQRLSSMICINFQLMLFSSIYQIVRTIVKFLADNERSFPWRCEFEIGRASCRERV